MILRKIVPPVLIISSMLAVGCSSTNALEYKVDKYSSDFTEQKEAEEIIDVTVQSKDGINKQQAENIASNEFNRDRIYSQINIKDSSNKEIAKVDVMNCYEGKDDNKSNKDIQYNINVIKDNKNKDEDVKITNEQDKVKLKDTYEKEYKKQMVEMIDSCVTIIKASVDDSYVLDNMNKYQTEKNRETSEMAKVFSVLNLYDEDFRNSNRNDLNQAIITMSSNYYNVMENMYSDCIGIHDDLSDLERKNFDESLQKLQDYVDNNK